MQPPAATKAVCMRATEGGSDRGDVCVFQCVQKQKKTTPAGLPAPRAFQCLNSGHYPSVKDLIQFSHH